MDSHFGNAIGALQKSVYLDSMNEPALPEHPTHQAFGH